MCQDTGTAIIMGKKGQKVWTGGGDEAAIARGVFKTYTETNLRYSQLAPLSMFKEKNTGSNLPAQIEIYATEGDAYKFLFMAKGGGSANKAFLYQQTPAVLNPEKLFGFLEEKIKTLGTAACPPYHLAIVIGGKYFCHDVRVIRLPRHGASVPIGLGVSCSADRQAVGKITREGVFLEALERHPEKYLPEVTDDKLGGEVVQVDLNRPMAEIRKQLSQYPIKTRLSLSGPMIVARDLAHTKMKERIDSGEGLPDYFKEHIIYYAGPAKTPAGYASGSFGPTTAGRMDSYAEIMMKNGGSFISLAKGNRSAQVKNACKTYGGFYLGSIGGSAARLAQDCLKKVELLEYPELGMEAVWRIEIENFPAFIIMDDKGNDFFADLLPE